MTTHPSDYPVNTRGAELAQSLIEAANEAGQALHSADSQERFWSLPQLRADPGLAAERERRGLRQLIGAAVSLSTALRTVTTDDGYWERLRESTNILNGPPLALSETLVLRELVEHQIPVLLDALGYRPPPPTGHWVDQLQTPIRLALAARTEGGWSSAAVHQARNELIVFVMRLDRLVEDASTPSDPVRPTMSDRARLVLREAVRVGREKAIPAALSAAAGAGLLALVAPAAPPVAGALAGIGLVAGQDLVKATVGAVSVQLLRGRTPIPGLSPAEHLHDSAHLVEVSVENFLQDLADKGPVSIDVVVIRRALFELLAAATEVDAAPVDVLWSMVVAVLDSLQSPNPATLSSHTRRLVQMVDNLGR